MIMPVGFVKEDAAGDSEAVALLFSLFVMSEDEGKV